MGALDSIPAFLITLAMVPVMGLAIVHVVREMIIGNVGPIAGIFSISALLGLFIASIVSRTPLVAGATLVVVLALGAFYPYAEAQMGRQIGREINIQRIDRAHEALSSHPDNVAAWFALAEGLYNHGFQGHAIAIADDILKRLSGNTLDPFAMTSMRDIFRKEESALKQWRRDADPKLCEPLRCPLCGAVNPPGPIACVKCGKPYLLELVRRQDHRRKFVGKLVAGWASLAVTITGSAYAGVLLHGWAQAGAVALLLVLTGLLLWWLFKPSRGDRTAGWEI